MWSRRSRSVTVSDNATPLDNPALGDVLLKLERLLGGAVLQEAGPSLLACTRWATEASPSRPIVGLVFHQRDAQEEFALDLAVSIEAQGGDVLGIGCSRPSGEDSDFGSALSRCGAEAVLSTLPMWSRQHWRTRPSLLIRIGMPFLEVPQAVVRDHMWASGEEPGSVSGGRDGGTISELAGLALRTARLRRRTNAHKRVAIALPAQTVNQTLLDEDGVSPVSASSVVALLYSLRHAGFSVKRVPPDGRTLINELIDAAPAPAMRHRSTTGRALDGLRLDLGNVLVTIVGSDRDATMAPRSGPWSVLADGRRLCGDWAADAIIHLGADVLLQWLSQPDGGKPTPCYPCSLGDPLSVVDLAGASGSHDHAALVLALSPPTIEGGQRHATDV